MQGQSLQDRKILVIDDDYHICHIIETALRQEGAEVLLAQCGRDGLEIFHQEKLDLIILDILMPEMDGWEVGRRIRAESDVPIIMLTALRDEDDIVRGLDFGAIDYVTKPFSIKVLLARVRAALRQASLTAEAPATMIYRDDYLEIDLDKRRITVEGEPVKLSATEYNLLSYLLQNKGKVLTFDEILSDVWGEEHRGSADYVRVYIWHLRKKLEKNHKVPQYIHTEYGVGYRFDAPS